MKIYLAGGETALNFLYENNVKNALISAYYYGYKKKLNNKFNFLVDSGGYTIRKKGIDISVYDYIEFINNNNLPLCITLDTNDIDETLYNQELLEAKTKAYIMPVYHYNDWVSKKTRSLLDDWIKKYPYISLGGLATRETHINEKIKFIEYVFCKTKDKIKIHGLGVTDPKLLNKFPFYSTDSTAWVSGGKFRKIISYKDLKDKKIKKFSHISLSFKCGSYLSQRTKMLLAIRKNTEYFGLLLNGTAKGLKSKNIETTLAMEKYFTELWKKRGVIWDE